MARKRGSGGGGGGNVEVSGGGKEKEKRIAIHPRDPHLCAYAFKVRERDHGWNFIQREHCMHAVMMYLILLHACYPSNPFQVTYDRQRGLIVFLRVYSGTLHAKETLQNSTRDARERPLQLLEVRADDLTPVERVGAGHTVAAVGLKETYTGDTLVAFKVRREGMAGRKERRGVDLSDHQPHTYPPANRAPCTAPRSTAFPSRRPSSR